MSFVTRCGLLFSVLAVAYGSPRRFVRSAMPKWHLPCGAEMEIDTSSTISYEEEVTSSLEILKTLHRVAMNDYLYRDYEFLYEKVRIGVHEHQYIPNWVPGKKDVNIVKTLVDAKPRRVSLLRVCEPCGLLSLIF